MMHIDGGGGRILGTREEEYDEEGTSDRKRRAGELSSEGEKRVGEAQARHLRSFNSPF